METDKIIGLDLAPMRLAVAWCDNMPKRVNYRRLAFNRYDPLCAHCGFGVPAVLEVAHIDGNRSNNELANLVILCPNCHKMHDLDLISTETIIQMRDRPKVAKWSKRMKDAGQKAALSRFRGLAAKKRRVAALKATATRKQNAALSESNGNGKEVSEQRSIQSGGESESGLVTSSAQSDTSARAS